MPKGRKFTGEFTFRTIAGDFITVHDSSLIPVHTANIELISLRFDIPPPPHTDEDHGRIAAVESEKARLLREVYGSEWEPEDHDHDK